MASLAACVSSLLTLSISFGGCSKKSIANPEDYEAIGHSFGDEKPAATPSDSGKPSEPTKPAGGGDNARPPRPKAAPVDPPGVDVSHLSEQERARLSDLADALPSPCGKAHSLRTSVTTDATCTRAPFAVRYITRLMGEGQDDRSIRDRYAARYTEKPIQFTLTGVPSAGSPDGRFAIVEFFDYGCPHCAEAKPILDAFVSAHGDDVTLYYKNFPLGTHPESLPAAQAALAAGRQGKFREMHDVLFEHQEAQEASDLNQYARDLGLDPDRFARDMADKGITARIIADRREGEQAGVEGTPTLFVNGHQCMEVSQPELEDWLAEELAVNR